MFMRFLHLDVNPDYLSLLRPFHEQVVIPALQESSGCLFAGLIQSRQHRNNWVSLTLWESKELAEAYERSDAFRTLMKRVKPYLINSSEWKIHLSQDLELTYEPVKTDLSLREYQVVSSKDSDFTAVAPGTTLHVRLVSMKLQQGKQADFREKYDREIVPALQSTRGCRYIYLTENLHDPDEIISLTIWDSREDADAYQNSGQFADLVERVKDLFSHFYQWKIALEAEGRGKVKTSDDLKVDHYAMVSGKRLK